VVHDTNDLTNGEIYGTLWQRWCDDFGDYNGRVVRGGAVFVPQGQVRVLLKAKNN
jgi:hypothetical protein